ncbi:MAG: acylphosphatase [Alphaproteobacteria bacterium]|jgi:acylphosphatase
MKILLPSCDYSIHMHPAINFFTKRNMRGWQMNKIITMRLIITGRVQGVGYRAWAKRNAQERELNGWVCNRIDGSVEMVISGAELNVQSMIEACSEGPLAAAVMNVESAFYNYEDIAPCFNILKTH